MYGRDLVAPPGNQAANGEHKLRPAALGETRLLDYGSQNAKLSDADIEIGLVI